VATVGLSVLLLRLAFIPVCPIPEALSPDDFSMLLAADTFAHGRLTNPTPAMWTHFESMHITMQPTYMSMYFPAEGLALAGGKVLFGHPWFGMLCTSAMMCAALCWMLQAWLPPSWALLGGMLAVLRLGLFSYWVNTYTGAGTIAALGGALVLGALPRLMKGALTRHALLLAAGIALLIISRPYEGFLLCLPVAAVLGRWALFGENRPSPSALLRGAAGPLAVTIAACVWMGYYDYRAFGSPLTLPYSVDRATYAMAPYYVWQSPRPEPLYRHKEMRAFYYGELDSYFKGRSMAGYLDRVTVKVHGTLLFFAGAALFLPLIMVRRVFLDRRIRFLILCLLVLMPGMAIEIYLIPHYLAPFTALFYAIGLQAMRHLRVWKPEGRQVGLASVRLTVAVCVLMAGMRLVSGPLHLTPSEWPPKDWLWQWYGPGYCGIQRAQLQAGLERLPGDQLVIVRYSPAHYMFNEWVYNAADIDSSKVIWAQEMDTASNLELIHYYKDRKVWLVQPDQQLATLSPYPIPEQVPAHSAVRPANFRDRGNSSKGLSR